MSQEKSADLASIRRFVQVVENTQWQRNADAFLALFAADAVWTNPVGRRLTGLQEISDFTRKGLKMSPPDVFATYEVEHVTFPSDDVAIVNVRSRAVRADRTPIPGEPDGAKLYVLVRHKKDWLLAAGHNTFVMEIPAVGPSPLRSMGEVSASADGGGAPSNHLASGAPSVTLARATSPTTAS
jgi:uncharacterized protein (TIGR02246 family)